MVRTALEYHVEMHANKQFICGTFFLLSMRFTTLIRIILQERIEGGDPQNVRQRANTIICCSLPFKAASPLIKSI